MTREEAIYELRHHLVSIKDCVGLKESFDALTMAIKALEQMPCEDATNGQVFIHIFGIDAWKQMIEFSKVNDQFREFWNAPYKAESEDK